MSNILSSNGLPRPSPLHRHGGRISAGNSVLPINIGADTYSVAPGGIIARMPAWPLNVPVTLRFEGATTLVHSAKLNVPGAANYITAAGDVALFMPFGENGAWQVSLLPASQLLALGSVDVQSKAGGYTAVKADAGSLLRFSVAATLALTAAATLGAKWSCWVLADGGDVVIDPNASETVNGLTTITVPNGCGGLLVCTGAAFHLVGGAQGTIVVADQKASGTDAGAFTSGADRTRVLNTVERNNIAGAALASNQITLPPGTYRCRASAPAYSVDRHRSWLFDTTGAATILNGTSETSPTTNPSQTRSVIDGEFTLTVQSVLELRGRCETTKTVNGLGIASSFGTEVYARVAIERVG